MLTSPLSGVPQLNTSTSLSTTEPISPAEAVATGYSRSPVQAKLQWPTGPTKAAQPDVSLAIAPNAKADALLCSSKTTISVINQHFVDPANYTSMKKNQEVDLTMSIREYWDEVNAEDWQPFGTGPLFAFAAVTAYILWQHLGTTDKWVFLLDHANLAIHEAGHPIVGIFSSRLSVYGGTLFQLLFPLLFIHHFWSRRQSLGFAASCLWLGASVLNVARYMADARAQRLPLVGGGEHDWTEIFSRWNVLASEVQIGGFFSFLGVGICVVALYWVFARRIREQ